MSNFKAFCLFPEQYAAEALFERLFRGNFSPVSRENIIASSISESVAGSMPFKVLLRSG